MVKMDPDLPVLVDVAVGDDDVPVALYQVDAGGAVADEHCAEGCLEGLLQAQADSFLMISEDLDVLHQGQTLTVPGKLADGVRLCGSLVGTDEMKGRAGGGHANPGPAGAVDGGPASL